MTLTEFLLARIAEDEASVVSGDCTCGDGPKRPDCADRILDECEAKRRIVVLHSVTWESQACQFCGGTDSSELGCAPADHGEWTCAACGYVGGDIDERQECPTLRALVLPYADHPECDSAWAPTGLCALP